MRGLATSLAWIIVCATSPAAAGGLELDGPTARAVARAGATTVSDDGGGALARNPAGLARRPTRRAQLGFALRDVDVEYDADGRTGPMVIEVAIEASGATGDPGR